MQFSQMISLASFATAALAAPAVDCNEPAAAAAATLPSTGSTDLPAPAEGTALKYLAIGHGLQNYTCASAGANATAVGALAVLYDATALFSSPVYANLSPATLWEQAIPLNLVNAAAAGPVSAAAPATQDELAYQAVAANPFPNPPVALTVGGTEIAFLGVHYFDAASAPTFDLSASTDKLFFSGAKTGSVKAPADANKGLLATGAVDWLQLGDNGKGLSSGVTQVYRVVTAGGVAEACSVSGATPAGQVFSVPYAAQYWFYG